MSDKAGPVTRERVWVTKFDHTTDPPRPIEEIFVENGEVVSVRTLGEQEGNNVGSEQNEE